MELTGNSMMAVTRDTVAALRTALMRDMGYGAAAYLQEAGYAGGASMFDAFRSWLGTQGRGEPDALTTEEFQARASEFFQACGWGSLSIGALHDAVATLDSPDWSEAMPGADLPHPCCHLSSGMFADFFGRVADAPLAVMEVECRSTGADRCRFLLGSAEVMQQVYEGMAAGTAYEDAVAAA